MWSWRRNEFDEHGYSTKCGHRVSKAMVPEMRKWSPTREELQDPKPERAEGPFFSLCTSWPQVGITGLQWPQNQEGTRCTESPFLGFGCWGLGSGLPRNLLCTARKWAGSCHPCHRHELLAESARQPVDFPLNLASQPSRIETGLCSQRQNSNMAPKLETSSWKPKSCT